jgi:uncharacterized Zn finger protein (UPF0148 family)
MQQQYQCPTCSSPINYGTKYCPVCGTQLNWPTQQPPSQYNQQQQFQRQQQIQQQYQQPYQQQYQQHYMNPNVPPRKKSRGWLIALISVVGIIVVIVIIAAAASGPPAPDTASTASSSPSTQSTSSSQSTSSTTEKTTTSNDDYIKVGMYKVGKDIQPGEFIIFADTSLTAYYQVSSDSSGSLESIVSNDNFAGNAYITVIDGQYLEFTRGKMYPINKAPALQPVNGKYPAGMYKVGRDISAGEYKVVSDGSMAYLAVSSDSTGTLASIVTNDNFTGEKYITVQNGQYIKLSRCYIVE